MTETMLIIQTLKALLKQHNQTYADVARELDLSEASVKRLFSDGHFSLQRLAKICQLINMDIADLLDATRRAVIVLDKVDRTVALSARNVPRVEVVTADELSVYEVLRSSTLIVTREALSQLERRLGDEKDDAS